jgi:cytochrome c oxidase cbb3-type subunit 3
MTDHDENFDQATGKTTTGHSWDGIKELNTPLPRWWVLTFYACIVWAFGYWIIYPAWPLVWGHTTGVAHYSSRADVAVELANLEKIRGAKMVTLGAAPLADIEKDPALLALARARGKAVFGDNCAPCHGSGAAGAQGFPNLNAVGPPDRSGLQARSRTTAVHRQLRRLSRRCRQGQSGDGRAQPDRPYLAVRFG